MEGRLSGCMMALLVKNQNKKMIKLVEKIKNLKRQLSYTEEESYRRLLLFRQAVVAYCYANNLPLQKVIFDGQSYTPDLPSSQNRKSTKFIKKLYREVASLTHPDKTSDPRLNSIFVKCSTALSNGFIYDIIESAADLNIKVKDISLSELVFLHDEILELEKSLRENKNTYSWVWFESGKDETYIKQFLNLKR